MMKAMRLGEVRQLVTSPEFKEWWQALVAARRALAEARERHEELLGEAMLMEFRAELSQKHAAETLYRGGDLEDAAAQAAAEVQAIENTSLENVAAFEEQRIRASEAWYRACAAEKRVEGLRELLERARRGEVPGRRSPEVEAARLEGELKRAERALAQAAEEDRRESAAKTRLWAEVERNWNRSTELELLAAEQRVLARAERGGAARLFQQAEDRRQRALGLRAEAEAAAAACEAARERAAEVLAQAGARFGAARGERFVYFRQRENARRVWCVALGDDEQSYNIEVRALGVYAVEPGRGVDFIEPAHEGQPSLAEGDRRFEEYFLHGRRGRVRGDEEERPAT